MIGILLIFIPVCFISFGLAAAPALIHLKQQRDLAAQSKISSDDFAILSAEIGSQRVSS